MSRRRRAPAIRWGIGIVVAIVLFGLGVAVGEALHDNPKPGGPSVTYVTTLTQP